MLIAHARSLLGAVALAWLAACGGGGGNPGTTFPPPVTPSPPAVQYLALTEVASVPDAVFLTAPPGDARSFIVERGGRIHILQNGALRVPAFLDISARVAMTGEGGLLSMAFDPGFASNGYFYVAYTDLANRIVVERFSAGATADAADPGSAVPIISIAHPDFTNHYGGLLVFGPDGFLYLGTGDGGGAGDPRNNSQNPASLLGKLLRLDVADASLATPYRIPPTNPFAGQSGKRAEIWALGLRNPWRYSFDADLLYIADVGQEAREEININGAGLGGLNYGWNIMEGGTCFNATTCATTGLILPAHQYDHSGSNGCSITGGDIYRGSAMPALAGHYFYSDYCGGYLKSLVRAADGSISTFSWPVAKVGGVVSFGRDSDGELYLIAASGKIYRIGSSATPTG